VSISEANYLIPFRSRTFADWADTIRGFNPFSVDDATVFLAIPWRFDVVGSVSTSSIMHQHSIEPGVRPVGTEATDTHPRLFAVILSA